MSVLELLERLYRVDQQLRGLRSRLDNAKAYYTAQQRQVEAVETRREELQLRRRHLQARIGNLEVEGKALDEQIEKYRNDLNGAATNKQYTAVLSELNTVKTARGKIDDAILEEMAQTEALDAEVTELETQVAERQKIVELAKEQLKEREGEVSTRLAELEQERATAAANVPPADLAVFEEISVVHDGEAMARVEEIDRKRREYACGECNMHLPFEQVAILMSSGAGIVRCTACGRILLLHDETRGALAPK